MKKRKLWLFVLVPLAGLVLAIVLISARSPKPVVPPAQVVSAAAPAQRPARANIWQRPAVADDPASRERRWQNENALMETASEAISATLTGTEWTDQERSQLRAGFADYRTGCLRIIKEPGAFANPADVDDPGLPWNVYEHRLQQILGKERAEAFENQYRERHLILVKSRRAGHMSAVMSAAGKQAAQP